MTNQKSSIEFISWNVNGLRACRKKTFDTFVKDVSPDFLCLQEVKLNPDAIPPEDFGYSFRHYHLAEKRATLERRFFPRSNPFP